ncbi:hypothetical protein ACIFQM_17580 [Paenibacillus sp. NRS-1782]|uniref:hypothetical protein n=1 Tax=unclassified Paenibacillus TaxID=185978 RepID=UPI003D2E85C3
MYRDELDALNAIHQEQQRTNELLERLLEQRQPVQKQTSRKPEKVSRDEGK